MRYIEQERRSSAGASRRTIAPSRSYSNKHKAHQKLTLFSSEEKQDGQIAILNILRSTRVMVWPHRLSRC